MRMGGRLAGAIEVLDDIEGRRRPVAEALKDWGLAHRFAGSGDRAAIGNIVYDALRMKLSHAWLMDDDSAHSLAFAVMLRQWGYTPETLAAELEGDTHAPAPLDAARLEAFSQRKLEDAAPHIQADMPQWIAALMEERFGSEWIIEAQALAARPSLDLRINSLKSSPEKVMKALDRAGAVPAHIARMGLRVPAGEGASRLPNVTAELSFQKGWFEIQDEGSQIVADLADLKAGDQVLDYCAGGGGKTLAMAATMENKGQVHAYDAEARRLAPIIERLKRAGTRNVQVHGNAQELESLAGRLDCVLVDAPCTGSGTWRRRPDTKWRLSERTLQERVDQQKKVLEQACRYVRPGGSLIYITCSMLPTENEHQVRRFCEEHSDFSITSAQTSWETLFPAAPKPHFSDEGTITLTPARTNTDGFFFCRMTKLT